MSLRRTPSYRRLVFVAVSLACAATALAYESYHSPSSQGAGHCATCHPTFADRGPLHRLHTKSGVFTYNCKLCHTGGEEDRDNPLTMWAVGDVFGPGYGCVGCHGRDYGETVEADYRGFPSGGEPKMSGYGLRKWHLNKGVNDCVFCHADVDQSFIHPESVDPPNYAREDVFVTSACNWDGSEDGTPEPRGGEDSVGLDNDGDLAIDGSDPDCGSFTPGEASPPALAQLLVSALDAPAGTLTLSYGPACAASDHRLEYGALTEVASYEYLGQECTLGTSGSYVWSYPTTPSALFFLVVGNDAAVEGSYGRSSGGAERPEDAVSTACPLPQELAAACQ